MKKSFLLLVSLVALAACVKMPKNGPNIVDGAIPRDFDWKTTKSIDLTVNVTSVAGGENRSHTIAIYNSPLLSSASLIASGSAKPNLPFKVRLTLATPVETLYIHELKPNGLATLTPLNITSASITTTITKGSAFENNPLVVAAGAPISAFTYPPLAIPLNFDQIINDNATIIGLVGFGPSESSAYGNPYKSYYIPSGFTRTGKINFGNWQSHAVLYVAGKLTLNSKADMNKSSIVVLAGGEVRIKEMSTSATTTMPVIYIESGGKLTIDKGAELYSSVGVNKGQFIVNEDLTLSGASSFTNDGAMTISDQFSVTNNYQFTNNGSITAKNADLTTNATFNNSTGAVITAQKWYQTNGTELTNHGEIAATDKFYNAGGGTLHNFCKITAKDFDFTQYTANLYAGSLMQSTTFAANNSSFDMAAGSMLLTSEVKSGLYKLTVNGSSPAGYALFKVTNTFPTLQYTQSLFTGRVELVYSGLTPANSNNYSPWVNSPAQLNKDQVNNIPGTSCNGSLGQIIPDEVDPGTPDPGTGSWTHFPSSSGWATYAFEDLWPSKGDYDLNDMVIQFRLSTLSDGSGKVTKIHFNYQLMALGASMHLAAGFQLDNVAPANVGSVTGQDVVGGAPFALAANNTEVGTSKAVIPLFNNPRDIEDYNVYLNTQKSAEHIPTSPREVVVTLSTPVSQSLITIDALNFFIVVEGRGSEVHLPGFMPTSKFEYTLALGKALHPDDIFKHQDGMMWGLMIPEAFSYPAEKCSIVDAYTHFAEWATSGGTRYPDWYSSAPGYRNNELIY